MSASESHIDVRSALKQGLAQLREAHIPSFTLAAELLLLHVLGHERTWLYAHPEEQVSSADAERFSALLARCAAGEPTEALTGEGLQIADIGTGSGCIAIAIAKELPGATIYATDISSAALAVAQRNAALHSVSNCIHFLECNLLDGFINRAAAPAGLSVVGAQHAAPLLGTDAPSTPRPSPVANHQSLLFDLIASNPPYIGRCEATTLMREVRDHEPEIALYGGEEGFELYAGLIAQSTSHLKPGGVLVLELGHNSLPAVQPLLDAPTWINVGVTNDLAGILRVIAAERLS